MTVFDGPNLTITLSATGGVGVIDALENLYEDWKLWLLESGPSGASNRQFPQAFRSTGGDPIILGSLNQGGYVYLRNDFGWRIRPFEESATILFTGNLVPQDDTLPIMIQTIGAFTVGVFGLQPVTQGVGGLVIAIDDASAFAQYDGSIWIDTKNGTAGAVDGVNGTRDNPCSNIADATIVAVARSLRSFKVIGNVVLTETYDDWRFFGLGAESDVNISGQDVSDSYFENLSLSGSAASSPIRTQDCTLDGVALFRGAIVESRIKGSLSLASGDTIFDRCSSLVAGAAATPTIDVVGAGRTFHFRHYSGGVEIRNMVDVSNKGSIDLIGQVIIAATCSAGDLALRGTAIKVDNSTGTTIDDRALVSNIVDSKQQSLIDSMAYDPAALNMMISARERIFATEAALLAATVDSVGFEGAVEVYTLTAIPGPTLGKPSSYRKTRIL